MSTLSIVALVSGALLLLVFMIVWYLNKASGGSHVAKLVQYASPFELAFDSHGSETYASGTVDGKWVVFNIQTSAFGSQIHIRMRTLMDFPLEVKLFFSTARQRNYLVRHGYKMAKQWERTPEGFYFQDMVPYPNASEFVGALGNEALDIVSEFEEQYDGLLIYDLDGSLFGKYDQRVMATFPEVREQTVLFAHIELTDRLSSDDFERFVRDAVKLTKAIEHDMQKLFPNWVPAKAPTSAAALKAMFSKTSGLKKSHA